MVEFKPGDKVSFRNYMGSSEGWGTVLGPMDDRNKNSSLAVEISKDSPLVPSRQLHKCRKYGSEYFNESAYLTENRGWYFPPEFLTLINQEVPYDPEQMLAEEDDL